jgi:hypothetical protein
MHALWLFQLAFGLYAICLIFMLKKPKESKKEETQEEAQKDAWENPRLLVPPVRKPSKPVDPDDIQISGPIPIIGTEDVSHSKTQPIPVVGVVGGGKEVETKVLQVQDHILESFYRKLADPKSYDWKDLPDDFRNSFGADVMPVFEPHIIYDTGNIMPMLSEMRYFEIPHGSCGKTLLETNVNVGGALSSSLLLGYGSFVHKTTVIRFIGDAKKEDIRQVLEGGVYEYIDSYSHIRGVLCPLSTFAPLNPFDPEPKVFFLVHKTILAREYGYVDVAVRFPRGLGPIGLFSLRIEFPGLSIKRSHKPFNG